MTDIWDYRPGRGEKQGERSRTEKSWAACLEMMAPGLLSGGKAKTMTETRAEKAQRLVDKHYVVLGLPGPFLARGMVKGKRTYYDVVLYPNGHYACDCAWGRIHSHTDDLCAHALAVKLAVEKEKER